MGKSILIRRNVLSRMHFRGEKHPDSERCSVRDVFPWEKHPQIIEPADRDAMGVSLPAYGTGWEV